MMLVIHLFVSSCYGGVHLIVENMVSSAASASAEQNTLGKRSNSQMKYLLMKRWEYFKQEAKKCKFSVNIKEKISKATSYTFFAKFWHTLRHTGISKTSIVWSTAGKEVFLHQEKGTKSTLHKPAQL